MQTRDVPAATAAISCGSISHSWILVAISCVDRSRHGLREHIHDGPAA